MLLEIIYCCVVMFAIMWSMKHLKKHFPLLAKQQNMEFNETWHVLLILPCGSKLPLFPSHCGICYYHYHKWTHDFNEEIEEMATFVFYIYTRYKFKLMKCKFSYLGFNDDKEKVKLQMKRWRMMHLVCKFWPMLFPLYKLSLICYPSCRFHYHHVYSFAFLAFLVRNLTFWKFWDEGDVQMVVMLIGKSKLFANLNL
jgi:hypothetical protein